MPLRDRLASWPAKWMLPCGRPANREPCGWPADRDRVAGLQIGTGPGPDCRCQQERASHVPRSPIASSLESTGPRAGGRATAAPLTYPVPPDQRRAPPALRPARRSGGRASAAPPLFARSKRRCLTLSAGRFWGTPNPARTRAMPSCSPPPRLLLHGAPFSHTPNQSRTRAGYRFCFPKPPRARNPSGLRLTLPQPPVSPRPSRPAPPSRRTLGRQRRTAAQSAGPPPRVSGIAAPRRPPLSSRGRRLPAPQRPAPPHIQCTAPPPILFQAALRPPYGPSSRNSERAGPHGESECPHAAAPAAPAAARAANGSHGGPAGSHGRMPAGPPPRQPPAPKTTRAERVRRLPGACGDTRACGDAKPAARTALRERSLRRRRTGRSDACALRERWW